VVGPKEVGLVAAHLELQRAGEPIEQGRQRVRKSRAVRSVVLRRLCGNIRPTDRISLGSGVHVSGSSVAQLAVAILASRKVESPSAAAALD